MLKFKKLANQVEIFDDVSVIYQDTFSNFQKDFQDVSGPIDINFSYEFMFNDGEFLTLNNADNTVISIPGPEWHALFDNIQQIITNKTNRDVNISILAVISDGLNQIDQMAGYVRSKVITVAPGQESTYMIKGQQAHAFKDAGYTGNVPPMMVAEINATGLSPQAATDAILEQEAQWIGIASLIEEIRRYSKIKVQEAATINQVKVEINNAVIRFTNLAS